MEQPESGWNLELSLTFAFILLFYPVSQEDADPGPFREKQFLPAKSGETGSHAHLEPLPLAPTGYNNQSCCDIVCFSNKIPGYPLTLVIWDKVCRRNSFSICLSCRCGYTEIQMITTRSVEFGWDGSLQLGGRSYWTLIGWRKQVTDLYHFHKLSLSSNHCDFHCKNPIR
ncbi:uncharacterized protein LOC144381418 isoform X2 [Halichoerus grypus]